MNAWLILLAAALAGAEGPAEAQPDHGGRGMELRRIEAKVPASGPMIAYDFRLITAGSLDWRGKLAPRLKRVGRQGGASVYEADAATLRDLLTFCQEDVRSNVLQAPRAVAPIGDQVRLTNVETIMFVGQINRIADGPVNHAASRLAFEPMVDEIDHGIRAEVAAHELTDSGLWTRLTVKLDRLTEFKTTQYSEEFRCEAAKSEPAGVRASGLNRLVRGNGSTTINATIQVPVVDSARVDGEG